MKLIYDLYDLLAAAEFIYKTNKYLSESHRYNDSSELYRRMKLDMIRWAKEFRCTDSYHTTFSTGGWTMTYSIDDMDSNNILCDITVSPQFGKYLSEEINLDEV